ncbi:MAG: TRAM domain-containing protein [Candidatus Hydrogenedentes bacterium]|nr:TRAM domain-containing protein [Candidatus Hydrogenedentota bacterium]MBI3119318.1 TRAM domain-containing protein [Candidatus Hydrogenedentota bacterium]
MTVKIVRGIFVLACVVMGGLWGGYIVSELYSTSGGRSSFFMWLVVGGICGGVVSAIILLMIHFVTQEMYEKLAPALVAIVLAMVMGYALGQYIVWWWPQTEETLTLRIFVVVSLVLVFGFIGTMVGLTRASSWESLISAVKTQAADIGSLKLVDTSVLIDGRISDVCDSGFVEGTLLVPRFVLNELQHIADSSDVLRRAKGRRGLDILKKLQDDGSRVRLEIISDDPKDVQDVDGKLVRLARQYKAKILTNDFNLNKVAQIEGILVLNLNDLANALKPAVLPDEQMEVKIIKDGKEPNQGVGYLDDGTMIVVDGGRQHMGRTVEVVVTSVLQTAAGRMIFGRFVSVLS